MKKKLRIAKSFEEILVLHKELWDFLAKNPNKSKNSWEGWQKWETTYNCFLCDYFKGPCGNCPLYHKQGRINCNHNESFYNKWTNAESLEEKKKWAEEIRDI